jgi:hypothetical protein
MSIEWGKSGKKRSKMTKSGTKTQGFFEITLTTHYSFNIINV